MAIIGLSSLSKGDELPDLPLKVVPFNSEPVDLVDDGYAPYPLEAKIQKILNTPKPADWKPTGVGREVYLDLAEPIVRMAVDWVDKNGAVIDPIYKKEWAQTSSRFASSAAVLIRFGRCREYLDTVCRVMEYCCRQMASGKAKSMSPDFWMRELITADFCLEGIAPAKRQAAWRKDLRKVDPENLYLYVDPAHGAKLKKFHNWAVYSSAGEGLRQLTELENPDTSKLSGLAFFDIYMPPQTRHITEYGMYRDPNDPITYDITTRLQFATPLAYGLKTPLRPKLEELLRRGGLTSLLFVSPEGYVPYGGRSSQFQFQEAMTAATFELEAQRYAKSNPALAGAFKRQAHLCALTSRRWIQQMDPIRHIKNGFPPQTSHGIDRYGKYSVYSLLASSFYGLAALFADDTIPEHPAPAELGGYVMELKGAFHKVFASAGKTYVEIDTKADQHYDSTGLGRVLFSGLPMETIIGMPFANQASYRSAPEENINRTAALGPVWKQNGKEASLARLSKGLQSAVEKVEESTDEVRFSIRYTKKQGDLDVLEAYTLKQSSLEYHVEVQRQGKPVENLEYCVPVIISDGNSKSSVKLEDNVLHGEYLDASWKIEWKNALARWEEGTVANRNGRYRLLRLCPKVPTEFKLTISKF